MELIGVVREVKADRAMVMPLSGEGDEGPGQELIIAGNAVGAGVGDRVRVEMPEAVGEGQRSLIYALPLGGVLAGAVVGRLMGSGRVADALERMAGGFLGPIVASGDNLALAGGLSGLILGLVLASWWIGKREQARAGEITEVIK